jgi:hypothetical protein
MNRNKEHQSRLCKLAIVLYILFILASGVWLISTRYEEKKVEFKDTTIEIQTHEADSINIIFL